MQLLIYVEYCCNNISIKLLSLCVSPIGPATIGLNVRLYGAVSSTELVFKIEHASFVSLHLWSLGKP